MPALLGNPELTHMRAAAALALDGTALIQSSGYTSDGAGGGTTAWANSGTLACRLAPASTSAETLEASRLAPTSEVIFTFEAGADVQNGHQIVYSGGTFAVTAVRQRSQEITHRVEAKRIV